MPVIISNKPSFKKFKETAQIQDFGGRMMQNYLLHYEWLGQGYKYRIALYGGTKEAALKAAYYLLFSQHSEEGMPYVNKKVLISQEGFKLPLSYNFKEGYNCSNFRYIKLRNAVISLPDTHVKEYDLV